MQNMWKRLIALFFVGFFTPFAVTGANLEFSEVMYDLKEGSDEGREWIEVYNNTDKSINLSEIKFYENDTNHKIIFFSSEEKIPPKSFAIITSNPEKFKNDWPFFSGNIFDSSFSLNNSGELLILKDEKGGTIDQFPYMSSMGADGDGSSLQKIAGVWQPSTPTPGGENKFSPVPVQKPKVVTSEKTTTPKVEADTENAITDPKNYGEEATTLPKEIEIQENKYIFWVIFGIFISGMSIFVSFIRRKSVISQASNDFTILE